MCQVGKDILTVQFNQYLTCPTTFTLIELAVLKNVILAVVWSE